MAKAAVFPKGVEFGIPLGKLVDFVAEAYGGLEAIVIDEHRKTWAQFREDCYKMASVLYQLNIHKGDRVGVWSRNRYEWMVAWFSFSKLGVIIVPMDSWYKPQEANFILHHSGAKAVFCTPDYLPIINDIKDCPNLEYVILMDTTTEKCKFKTINIWEMFNKPLDVDLVKKITIIQDSLNGDDVMLILYTSGTTGFPKGAMLTHNNMVGNGMEVAKALRTDTTDAFLIPVPFSHCFGCVLGMTVATTTGSKMVPLKDQTPSVALQTIMREKCSVLHGAPTHFIRYIRELEAHPEYDITSLRTGIMAGAPCPPDTMGKAITFMHISEIIIGYGLTETSPIISLTQIDDPFEKRINTVGKAIPNVEVRVVDDDEKDVPLGVTGELLSRGPYVMKGYFNEPELTKEAINPEGWLHTGDLASMDADGYIAIQGRKKDMINYGGAKVYPKMVEDFLLTNPKIYEVSVVGVPDPEYGEITACAARVAEGFTEQDLVDFCYGQISDPSVPRFVRFDVNIPLSGRGKVQKFKLRDAFKEMIKTGTIGPKYVPTEVKKKKQQK